MRVVDPHVHFFALEQGCYDWLKPGNPPHWEDKARILQTFSDDDLQARGISLQGVVHIEAGFDNAEPWREVHYLEQKVSVPLRTIAGYDLTRSDPQAQVAHLLPYSSLKGVRHILDEHAFDLLSGSAAQQHFTSLHHYDLQFEAQLSGTDSQGMQALEQILRRSGVRCVLNHACFAPPDTHGYALWRRNMQLLASNEAVAVKVSGFEMLRANRHWDRMFASRVISDLLGLFGSHRVMLASNFPLCLFSQPWASLWQSYTDCIPADCQDALLADNAWRWYGFNQ